MENINDNVIGKQVVWTVFGWLGPEAAKGIVVKETDKKGVYQVEGQTLFGQRCAAVKNVNELTFC